MGVGWCQAGRRRYPRKKSRTSITITLAAPVHRHDGEMWLKERGYGRPAPVIGRGAVDEKERGAASRAAKTYHSTIRGVDTFDHP